MTDESVDRLNAVGVLTRREIEARILAPVVDALGQRFGRDEVIAVVRETVAGIARAQGQAMAAARNDASLSSFAQTLGPWTKDDALRLRVLREAPGAFDFELIVAINGVPEVNGTPIMRPSLEVRPPTTARIAGSIGSWRSWDR